MPSRILSADEIARLDSLTPRFGAMASTIVQEINIVCGQHVCHVVVTYGRRSSNEQLEIWSRGRQMIDPRGSTMDPHNWRVVGQTYTNAMPGSSPHEYGEAVDVALVAPIPNGTHSILANGDSRWYTLVGRIAEEHGAIWGGRFRRRDFMHFEHPRWRELRHAT